MERKGLISVIIPVYNVEQYLHECVDSVLNQTYQNFEIILVDDGSKDQSGYICDEYAAKDERIRCIHKENGGASSARNVGIDIAEGEFIYFLDSDDLISFKALQKLYEMATAENADIVFFEADTFTEKVKEKYGNYSYRNKYDTKNGRAMLSELIENKEFHVSIPLLFIRHSFLSHTGKRFFEGIMYEDMILTYELFNEAETIAHCKRKLYHRRYHDASVMTSPKRLYNYISAETVYFELIAYMKAFNLLDLNMSKMYISRWAMNCLDLYSGLQFQSKKKYRDKHLSLKKSILNNQAFGNKVLKARCYGKIPWIIAKCSEKIGIK